MEEVLEVMDTIIPKSLYMQGKGKSDWIADFDWFIEVNHFQNVAEGKYIDLKANKKTGNKLHFDNENDLDFTEYEAAILSN